MQRGIRFRWIVQNYNPFIWLSISPRTNEIPVHSTILFFNSYCTLFFSYSPYNISLSVQYLSLLLSLSLSLIYSIPSYWINNWLETTLSRANAVICLI